MDETILKPRPGRMGRNSAPASPNVQEDDAGKTIISSNSKPAASKSPRNVAIHANPLLDAGTDCFSLVVNLNKNKEVNDIATLKHSSVEAIKRFEMLSRGNQLPLNLINDARYCLCALIDELVLNASWSKMEWAEESLLSTFHKETFGGEYFFTLLDSALALPEQHLHLLELQFHCLNLGFKGKFRVEKDGEAKLDDYRNRLYQVLLQTNGPAVKTLSPNWRERVAAGIELRHPIPLWVVFSVLGLLALFVYTFLNMQLNSRVDKVEGLLASVHPITEEVVSKKDEQLLVLQQLLQTEIQMGLVSVILNDDRIRIVINNNSLFNPGEAQLLSSFEPILQKLALSLEGTQGKILITGHTDDSPIRTDRYPSNWHLSLARATQIANFMLRNTNLNGRLWPEGKGAAEPIVSNSDADKRALNRRIEIDLLF